MIQAILFDMDGVLVDSELYYMNEMKKMLNTLGSNPSDEFFYRLVGSSWTYTYEQLRIQAKHVSDEVFHQALANYQATLPPYDQLIFSDTKQVLKDLKAQNYLLAICSSSSLKMIHHMLDVCQLHEYFDYIISGESLKESKPHPQIYLEAAQYLHVNPSQCIVIEDSSRGIEAGKRANMKVYAIHDHHFGMDQSQADGKIEHLSELFDYLK